MMSHRLPRPTDAELAILRVLWDHGPTTVKQVQLVLEQIRPTGYTTVLKLLQIMTEKGLVTRTESGRSHVYAPRLSQDQTQRQLVRDLLDRAFGGSAAQMVMQALDTAPSSRDELKQIRDLLDRREGDSNDPESR
jgi:BlaI family transcriptional regulator, penicillinase repressor